MKPEIKYILKEMCKRVGADFNSIDFGEDNWYWKYMWTEEQGSEFVMWLTKQLYEKTKLRKAIGAFSHKSVYNCTKIAESFVNNYGWKVK